MLKEIQIRTFVKKCNRPRENLQEKEERVRENVEEYHSLFNAPTDAVGQEIPREENKKKRRAQYSWMGRMHTERHRLTTYVKGAAIRMRNHVKILTHVYSLSKDNRPKQVRPVGDDLDLEAIKNYLSELAAMVLFKKARKN